MFVSDETGTRDCHMAYLNEFMTLGKYAEQISHEIC